MEKIFKDLAQLSHYAAQHPRFVQGGGGNCSVKFAGKMAVKASGYFLEDVDEKRGYAVLELKAPAPADANPKPSMEANLHTLLGDYVIHTHPVAVAALVCAEEGKKAFDELFSRDPEFHWIPYATPGAKLYQQVKKQLIGLREGIHTEQVLFLQNHGLFVSAASAARCIEVHEEIIEALEDFFGDTEAGEKLPKNCYLTPDHAVYANQPAGNLSAKQKISAEEIEVFSREVFKLIKRKNWQPRWLSQEDVAEVLGMDEEKYRQQLWGKKS